MSTMEDETSTPLSEVITQHSSIAAQNAGVANVPQMTGCNIGSLSMNLHTNVHTAANVLANAGKTHGQSSTQGPDIGQVREKLKCNFRRKCEMIFEGLAKRGNPALLGKIYTELYITEGERGGLNKEHEIRKTDVTPSEQDVPVFCNNIFKPLNIQDLEQGNEDEKTECISSSQCERLEQRRLRTVLTVGIAGIGKTVSVQKFILDWAEGNANRDVDLVLVLPFRELNSYTHKNQSLHDLLLDFHSELKEFGDTKFYTDYKIIFIFDGLDESQLPLDFGQTRVSDVSKPASLDELMTNLIGGNLLPSALVWITSRLAAIDKIPPNLIHRMTEVRGFTDLQKDEYFRKRFSDRSLANRIISHVKGSRSLEIMCHIPVFCWITATVLEQMLKGGHETIPTSLTEMYTRFLLIQTSEKIKKYHGIRGGDDLNMAADDVQLILKLGKLAFDALCKSNFVFSEDDLRKHGIDVDEASLKSGFFTEIFRQEDPMFSVKRYSFVHLSFQEFLAALYVLHTFTDKGTNAMLSLVNTHALILWFKFVFPLSTLTLYDLHKYAIDEALKSRSGHLDLFLRFLLGLSMDNNQKLLKSFSMSAERGQERIHLTAGYLKNKIEEEDNRDLVSVERSINLFHCLLELNDHSMVDELKRILEREDKQKLIDPQALALARILHVIGNELDSGILETVSLTDSNHPPINIIQRYFYSGAPRHLLYVYWIVRRMIIRFKRIIEYFGFR